MTIPIYLDQVVPAEDVVSAVTSAAKELGFKTSIFAGKRRYFPDINNTPQQRTVDIERPWPLLGHLSSRYFRTTIAEVYIDGASVTKCLIRYTAPRFSEEQCKHLGEIVKKLLGDS